MDISPLKIEERTDQKQKETLKSPILPQEQGNNNGIDFKGEMEDWPLAERLVENSQKYQNINL